MGEAVAKFEAVEASRHGESNQVVVQQPQAESRKSVLVEQRHPGQASRPKERIGPATEDVWKAGVTGHSKGHAGLVDKLRRVPALAHSIKTASQSRATIHL